METNFCPTCRRYRDTRTGRFVSVAVANAAAAKAAEEAEADMMGDLLTYSAPAAPAVSAKVARRRAGYVNRKFNRGLAVAV
jgi:hypothetical protein